MPPVVLPFRSRLHAPPPPLTTHTFSSTLCLFLAILNTVDLHKLVSTLIPHRLLPKLKKCLPTRLHLPLVVSVLSFTLIRGYFSVYTHSVANV